MKRTPAIMLAALFIGLGLASRSEAVPVTWYLVDWAFQNSGSGGNGRTATGSFVYETSNNSITSWDLTVSPATYFNFDTGANVSDPAFTYSNSSTGHTASVLTSGDLLLFRGNGRQLRFDPAIVLPAAGGDVLQGTNNAWRVEIFAGGANQAYTTTGYFSTTNPNAVVVPEPSMVLLGLVGGIALTGRRRRAA